MIGHTGYLLFARKIDRVREEPKIDEEFTLETDADNTDEIESIQ